MRKGALPLSAPLPAREMISLDPHFSGVKSSLAAIGTLPPSDEKGPPTMPAALRYFRFNLKKTYSAAWSSSPNCLQPTCVEPLI